MAKLPRVTQKIFAQNSGTNDVTVFGTAKNGNDAVFTKDINQIMNSDAFSQGWGSATLTDDAPFQEDMNGVQLTSSQQLAYLFENGMPEWDENTTYYANTSFCQVNGVWYQSLTDNNIGNNPINDNINWYKIDLDKLNPDLSNLTSVGIDKINQSKALETGSVSSDADVYADIQKYAHSTFDLSKFTVVGSPTITDDGVVNKFTYTNYPSIANNVINKLENNSWKIRFAGISPQSNTTLNITGISTLATGKLNIGWINGTANFFLQIKNSTTEKAVHVITNKPNTPFVGYAEFDGTNNYTIAISFDGGKTFSKNTMTAEEKVNFEGANLPITTGSDSVIGSIDLKSIAIWAGGIPVFSGNKTGIDTIKPDNYEVVGSPVISDDGVLSGVSVSNYVSFSKSITFSNNVEIYFNGSTDTLIGANVGENPLLTLLSANNAEIACFEIHPSGTNQDTPDFYILLKDTNGANIINAYAGSNLSWEENVLYYFRLTFDGTTYTVARKTAGQDYQVFYTLSSTTQIGSVTGGYIGKRYANASYNKGDISLSDIRIFNNDYLVYQPCLKIPYTESKTGSKIVDAAYRDRVLDMYEQYGYAPYYTIDEQNQNFTLPMGDIYGMITKNREILDIVYPIGRPMPEENNVLLDNEVWLEGATVNPVDYPKLFKVYGTKYGGDGITTFVLPDMRGRVLWGSSDGSNGYIEAKLPNIKGGSVLHSQDADGALNGCFYTTRSTISGNAQFPSNGRTYATYGAGINANLSNEIYSDDATTVQPPAFKVRWKTRFE